MTIWGIFFSAFLVGFSGAMMPGPMLGITIDGSLKRGYMAGPLVVLGHGILEFILIMFMAFGLKDFFSNSTVAGSIGVVGGVFLVWMGYGMIKSSIQKTVSIQGQQAHKAIGKNIILAGAIVSATNPYFIMWWATTGIEFVRQAYALGFIGVIFFFFGHILADLTWYSSISFAFSRSQKFISDTIYRWLILLLGVFIVGFSIYFIVSGWEMLATN